MTWSNSAAVRRNCRGCGASMSRGTRVNHGDISCSPGMLGFGSELRSNSERGGLQMRLILLGICALALTASGCQQKSNDDPKSGQACHVTGGDNKGKSGRYDKEGDVLRRRRVRS
jgi:hypothetical protein